MFIIASWVISRGNIHRFDGQLYNLHTDQGPNSVNVSLTRIDPDLHQSGTLHLGHFTVEYITDPYYRLLN